VSELAVNMLEWETVPPDFGSPLAGRSHNSDATRRLAERLTEAGCIEVFELARGIELRATSFVGRIALGEFTVTIQPKLPGAPFLNLLRYAYGLRHLALFGMADYGTDKWTFQDLIIQQLVAEISELLARGVHREYERVQADLTSPRGRIEFHRLVGMQHRANAELPCVHYPRLEDTVLNQTTLAGMARARRLTANVDLRAHLGRLSKTLSSTVSLKKLTWAMLDDAKARIDRRTMAYSSALQLIEILLGSDGISLDSMGHLRLPGFLFDMNRFFQALISRFLHDHLEGYEVQDEFRLKGLFSYDSDRNPRKRRAPVQKPDFIVRRNRNIEAILDAKYRDLWENALPREMLYQLALYALGRAGKERTAAILYPTLAADAAEQVIQLREPVSGNFQAQVILRPVKLLALEKLLRDKDWKAWQRKAALARQFSFGDAAAV
jgi:5-methylcytosine-specific restriction enzyme subunit McrC